jgi:hypothetical protein
MIKQAAISLCALLFTFGSTCHGVDLPQNYESKTAEEKMEIMFDLVKAQEGTSGRYPNIFGNIQALFRDDFSPTVDHISDIIPYDHEKRIHSVGAVATMKFINTHDHSYTGIFKGTSYAMVRLSSARAYSEFGGPIPGMAAKFFIDGVPSVNVVAMNAVDGQDSGNFFERNFSNHISPTVSFFKSMLFRKFEKASSPAALVGLSEIALYNNDGSIEDNPIFPFELILVPNKILRMKHADMDKTDEDLRRVLESIPAGTKIYDVYGRATPSSDREPLGEMIITSKLMYSKFGDENLFFRHQKMEDDLVRRPEWRPAMPSLRNLRERCPLGFDDEDDESM